MGLPPGEGAPAADRCRQAQGLQFLLQGLLLQLRQLLVTHPMDAIDRTGVDGLLDRLRAVAVLADGPGASPLGLHNKGIAGHVGAVTAANTDGFVDPDRLLTQGATEHRLMAAALKGRSRRGGEGNGGIDHHADVAFSRPNG